MALTIANWYFAGITIWVIVESRCLLCWCAEHFERFVDFEAFRQCCSVYQVGCFRAEPLFFRE